MEFRRRWPAPAPVSVGRTGRWRVPVILILAFDETLCVRLRGDPLVIGNSDVDDLESANNGDAHTVASVSSFDEAEFKSKHTYLR